MATNNYERLPLFGPDSADDSLNVNAQLTQNMWPRMRTVGSRNVIAMYGVPGLTEVGIAPSGGPCRGNGVRFGDYSYMVVKDKLLRIDSVWTVTEVGTLNSTASNIQMVAGRAYLMIVDGTDGYTYNGTTFAQITDLDFPADPSHAAYLGGYFITNKGDSDEFYISTNEDPTSWAALDFESAAEKPDDCFALETTSKDLYILGSESVQVYYNSSDPLFPFTLYTGAVLNFGIQAPYSLVSSSSGLFFLGTAHEGGIFVIMLNGFQGVVISNDIADDLKDFTTTSDAYAYVYRNSDKTYYHLTFPTEGRTFEYIVEDQFWVERKSNGLTRHLSIGHVYFNNVNVVGDINTGEIYKIDGTVYTEDGTQIERIRRTQNINKGSNGLIFHELVLMIEAGVGNVVGAGANPEVAMRYSDDGGHNWSSWLNGQMGAIGATETECYWTKLGFSENGRVFEFKVTDPVKTVFVDAYARVTVTR